MLVLEERGKLEYPEKNYFIYLFCFTTHARYKIGIEKIYICYRQSGEEALGETKGLIE